MSIRSIMVPLDGSASGEWALPMALSLARRAGARIELIHVHERVIYPDLGSAIRTEDDLQARHVAANYLDDVAHRVAKVSSVPCTPLLLEGRIAEALFGHASTTAPNLVVMSTHGRSSLSRFWLGSVTNELIQRLSVPVLAIRPSETPPKLSDEPALRRILIPLDGSPFAEQILSPASVLGSLHEAEYRLVRVVPPVVDVESSLVAMAETYLQEIGNRLGRPFQMTVLEDDHTAEAILEDANTHETNLIALATHGRSGIVRLFLGSVADKLVRGTTLPVLLLRPADGDDS